MKLKLLNVFFLFPFSFIWGQENVVLSTVFIKDSLKISSRVHVFHDKLENFISTETPPIFNMKIIDDNLEKLIIKFDDLLYNYIDTTIIVKAAISNIKENDTFGKNVNMFIGSDFSKKYGMVYGNRKLGALRTIYNGEPTDSIPIFTLNNSRHNFAHFKVERDPKEQVFDCKFKIRPKDRYLIFALYNYELIVFDLKDILPCFLYE